MAPSTPQRTVLPKATKQQAIDALLAGTTTVEKVCEKLNVQQYQVFAWVGAYALARRETIMAGGVSSIDPELAKAIGEYYLRKGIKQQ